METIRIGDDRLKIMLTKEDLARYDLGGRPLDPDSEEVGKALRRLVLDAGFEGGEGRLYLQLYESKEGGCELFVTRLPAEAAEVSEEEEEAPPSAAYLRFASLSDAVLLAKRLTGGGAIPESRLLHEGGVWYLAFPHGSPAAACDYGDTLPASAAAYITEYGKTVLGQNAIEALSAL